VVTRLAAALENCRTWILSFTRGAGRTGGDVARTGAGEGSEVISDGLDDAVCPDSTAKTRWRSLQGRECNVAIIDEINERLNEVIIPSPAWMGWN
jgi:hypothetical protein